MISSFAGRSVLVVVTAATTTATTALIPHDGKDVLAPEQFRRRYLFSLLIFHLIVVSTITPTAGIDIQQRHSRHLRRQTRIDQQRAVIQYGPLDRFQFQQQVVIVFEWYGDLMGVARVGFGGRGSHFGEDSG